jgi:hypothetical protein
MLAEILSVLTAMDTIHAAMRAIIPGYGQSRFCGASAYRFGHSDILLPEQHAIVPQS